MKHRFLITSLAFVLAITLSGVAVAQLDLNGPNAALTLQNQNPAVADPIGHRVLVGVPGLLDIGVNTGANPAQGIILLASPLNTSPVGLGVGAIATPWGGAINLVGPSVVGDGVGGTGGLLSQFFRTSSTGDFNLAFGIVGGAMGNSFAVQCIVQEPAFPPFFLDNTAPGDATFVAGQTQILPTNDDGVVSVAFLAGQVFNFHGTAYTEVYVTGNGCVSFGGIHSLPAGGFYFEDDLTFANDLPAIAINRADWNPVEHDFNDGVLYQETQNAVRISWGDPMAQSNGGIGHCCGTTDVNDFELLLTLDNGIDPNEGTFVIGNLSLDQINTPLDGNGGGSGAGDILVGHSPGNGIALGSLPVNVASVVDKSLRLLPDIGLAGDAQFEEHKLGANPGFDMGWDGLGSPRNYNNATRHYDGVSLTFAPTPGGITGSQGYTSIPSGPVAPDDIDPATPLSLTALDVNGGETVTINGSFLGFSPTIPVGAPGGGEVVFDALGALGGPFAAGVVGVLDNAGLSGVASITNLDPSVRDSQALVIVTSAFINSGIHTYDVNFENGSTFSGTVNVTLPGVTQTNLGQLPDDGGVTHALSGAFPISFYGVNYTSLNVNSNGNVTFGPATNGDFTGVAANYFNGLQSGITGVADPVVALYGSDLNSGMTGVYEVVEDANTLTVTVSMTNQNIWSSAENIGGFTCSFGKIGAGSVEIDLSGFVASALATEPGAVVGVSDGDTSTTALGTDTDLSNGVGDGLTLAIAAGGAFYVSPGANDSVLEVQPINMPIGGPTAQTLYQYIDTGLNGTWNIF